MPEEPSDNTVRIDGGQVVAGNIGGSGNTGTIHGGVTTTGGDQAALRDALTELRAELAALRGHLTETEGADAEPADVDDVLDALEDPEPDLDRARGRWDRLRRRIPAALPNLDTLTKIADLFERVRGFTQ
ncbi:hypothetical protein [Nocardia puris]|uniref:Uncharacterized protein n=1 Tax=Nocardia puris TaxID=208602 RepID=A0A366DHV4_9NOCA|nr:hypothetical protein [Nocardia puris]RBO89601.1 hypothetical protein DFR74_107279 [Nocardia puris]